MAAGFNRPGSNLGVFFAGGGPGPYGCDAFGVDNGSMSFCRTRNSDGSLPVSLPESRSPNIERYILGVLI